MHSTDLLTILIVLLCFSIVPYSSLFQYLFYWSNFYRSTVLSSQSSWKFLIFYYASLLIITDESTHSASQEVPFGIPKYIQCILEGLSTLLPVLCVPFIFADSEKHWFGGCTWWLPLCNRNHPYFLQRCFSNSFWFVLLHNELNIADSGYFSFRQ